MSSKTTNYKMTKPASNDFVNIEDFNGNFDIIDAQMKDQYDTGQIKTDQLTASGDLDDADYIPMYDASETKHAKVMLSALWAYLSTKVSALITNAIASKQDKLTFDTTATRNSVNPVTSSGVKTSLDDLSGNYDPKLIAAAACLYSLSLALGASFGGTAFYDALNCLGVLTAAEDLTVGTAYTIGTLPIGYRPTIVVNDYDSAGNTISISTAGVITLTPVSAILSGSPLYFYAEW